ncbi:MAG TPA: HDIG domain-containing protein [bacterium]|nr:HDIG domain-containing protein [bacterium]HQP97992.1 HDIG domain-containing protein [bacterium]
MRWPGIPYLRKWTRSTGNGNGGGIALRFREIRAFFTEQSLRLLRGCIVLAMMICLFLLARPSGSSYLRGLEEGDIPSRPIKAAFAFEYEDQDETEKRRTEAASQVRPVYEIADDVIRGTSTTFAALVIRLKELDEQPMDAGSLQKWIASVEQDLSIQLDNKLYPLTSESSTGPSGTWAALVEYRKYESFWAVLGKIIDKQLTEGIVDNRVPIDQSRAKADLAAEQSHNVGIILKSSDGEEFLQANTESLLTRQEFLDNAKGLLQKEFPKEDLAILRSLGEDILEAVVTTPTLTYLREDTEKQKDRARAEVAPVMVPVKEGIRLVAEGEQITARQVMILQAYQKLLGLSWVSETGLFILALGTSLIILAYLRRYHRPLSRDPRQMAVVLLIFVLVLTLARIASYLARLTPDLENVGFAVPIGALGVLITLLASGRLAAFLVAMGSVYAGLIYGADSMEYDLRFAMVGCWSGFAAIMAVHGIRQRSDLYRAGFLVAIMSVLIILALSVMDIQDFDHLSREMDRMKWTLQWGLVNGALVFMLSIATLPLFEDMLGVTTDIKLLELGQKTLLLQRLEKEAPGTYQHTMTVSTLAESAAESIGANALLTRVGAYYHDIGKMVKPAYFTENQQTASDKARHAKLKPQMSVLVIRNHVKYGLELAKEYKLPRVIQDFIPEHHGTTLIAYFYNQVLASQPAETVREEDFRYPGPKPRSKETAIVMLADTIEAVSRTLSEPNEGQIRVTVQKIVNDRFFDGQFDECKLTLADLRKLVDSFSDSLTHMLHQRIKYPPRPPKRGGPTDPDAEEDTPLSRTPRLGVA